MESRFFTTITKSDSNWFYKLNGFKTMNQNLYTDIKNIKVGHGSTVISGKEVNVFMIQKKKSSNSWRL